MIKWTDIPPGRDAVFLPNDPLINVACIIYINECANDGNGSVEIEYVDSDSILKLNEEVKGNAKEFFEQLPDWFHGKWYYCDNTPEREEEFDEWINSYYLADYVVGRDGDIEGELNALVKWAQWVTDAYLEKIKKMQCK